MLLRNNFIKSHSQTLLLTREILINSFNESDRIYVETTGNDTTGDGTKGNPYATLEKVRTSQSGSLDGKCVIVKDGTHQITPKELTNYTRAIFSDSWNGATVILMDDVVVQSNLTFDASWQTAFIGTSTGGSNVFTLVGGTVERDNNGSTGSTNPAIFSFDDGIAGRGYAYNVVFKELNANGNVCLYNGPSGSNYEAFNCLFVAGNWLAGSNSSGNVLVKNCATTSTTNYNNATVSNNIDNVTVDVEYHIQGGGVKFDGADDYLQIAAHSDFAFGTNDFTLKARLTLDALSERYLFGPGGRGSTYTWSAGWGVRFDPTRGLCFFKPAGAGGSGTDEAYAAWSPTIDQEYSIEIRRESSIIKMFIDDVEQTVTQSSNSEDIGCTLNFRVGHSANTNGSYDFDGIVHELEVINNVTQVLYLNESAVDQSASQHTVTKSGDVIIFGDKYQGVYSGFYGWGGFTGNSTKYRYFQVYVTDEVGSLGLMLSDIVWYQGVETFPKVTMTSNNAPSPLTTSSSSVQSATYQPWKAYNGSTGQTNSWQSDIDGVTPGDPEWITVDIGDGNEFIPTKVKITPFINGNGHEPKDFEIRASVDGVDFDTLASFSGITDWSGGFLEFDLIT